MKHLLALIFILVCSVCAFGQGPGGGAGPGPNAVAVQFVDSAPSTCVLNRVYIIRSSGVAYMNILGSCTKVFNTAVSLPASASQGDLLYGSAANVYSNLAKDANATRYLSNTGTSNNPAWAQVNLANGVTGSLPETSLSFTDVTTNDSGITKHGFLPKLPNDATKFLNGLGAWAVPPTTSPGGSSGDIQTNNGAGGFGAITPGSGVATFLATPSGANLASALTTALPVSKGGTNCLSASITCFNNITGFTAAGTTGTTSTNLVFSTSPTLVTPALGAATATTINGNTFTTGTYTLTGAAGKTLTFNNTLTINSTDGITMTTPTTSFTGARTDAAQTFTGNQIIVGTLQVATGGGVLQGATSLSGHLQSRNPGNTDYGPFRASQFLVSRTDDSIAIDIGRTSQTQINFPSTGLVGFNSGANGNASPDATVSRQGVGVVQIGTTTTNASGALYAANAKFGGTATRGTTEGTNKVDIYDGTAPVGTLANGISLYSTAGELRVLDAGGTATLLSPHDHATNEWIYYSVNTRTGKILKIDMERMLRFLNEKFGTDFVHEYASEGEARPDLKRLVP